MDENIAELFLAAKKVCDEARKTNNPVSITIVDLEQALINIALEGNSWAEEQLKDWRE